MEVDVTNQLRLFLIFFISGAIVGIFFDIFRIVRRAFRISDIHTSIQDIIFGIVTGIFLIFIIFVYNKGAIRWFMFFGLILRIFTLFIHFEQIFY